MLWFSRAVTGWASYFFFPSWLDLAFHIASTNPSVSQSRLKHRMDLFRLHHDSGKLPFILEHLLLCAECLVRTLTVSGMMGL